MILTDFGRGGRWAAWPTAVHEYSDKVMQQAMGKIDGGTGLMVGDLHLATGFVSGAARKELTAEGAEGRSGSGVTLGKVDLGGGIRFLLSLRTLASSAVKSRGC